MPQIFTCEGYSFRFYSNDHTPEHCHAEKNGAKIKVEFSGDGKSHKVSKLIPKSKVKFKEQELRDIVDFCNKYANKIVKKFRNHFEKGLKIKCENIRKIK